MSSGTRLRDGRPASSLGEKAVACEPSSHLSRDDGNAQRSGAGWVRREINCTAGWSSAGRSWRWHWQSLAIRWLTDERRAQPRVASKRVRVLQEPRRQILGDTGVEDANEFLGSRAAGGVARMRLRDRRARGAGFFLEGPDA